MPSNLSEEHLLKVNKAAAFLEEPEAEYPLQELVEKSNLSKEAVLQVLKEHWIKADHLDILHLDLTEEEESLLYDNR